MYIWTQANIQTHLTQIFIMHMCICVIEIETWKNGNSKRNLY